MNPNTPVTYEGRYPLLGRGREQVHKTNFDLRGKEAADDYIPAWSEDLGRASGQP